MSNRLRIFTAMLVTAP